MTAVAAAAPSGDRSGTLAGTPRLVRLIGRLERVRAVVWMVALTALVLASASSISSLYSTPEELATYAALAGDSAAVVIQSGPGYGLDDPTTGAVLMNEVGIWSFLLIALMNVFLVTRHTRADEESTRAELLRAAPVGRDAATAATLATALVTDVLVAAAVVVGLLATGYGTTGSLAFGASLVGIGMVFAGVALVSAQVVSSPRAANGLGLLVLVAAFLLRAVGDVGDGRLSWLSPIGWAQAIRAFADERWWVLALPVAATVGLVVAAGVLAGHRDVGAGMVPERIGRDRAGRHLGTPVGLAVRLQRATVLAWAVGVAVIGAFYGAVTTEVERMLEDNPDLADFFAQYGGASVIDAFLATSALMLGLLASGFAVASVLRIHGEESAGRGDVVLATPTSRRAWAGGHVLVAAVGLVLLLAVGGLALGIGAALSTGDGSLLGASIRAALNQAPAVAVLAAVGVLVVGAAPRLAPLAWIGVAVAVVVGLFGDVLDLPGWVRGVSPFHHLAAVPAVAVDPVRVAALLAAAAALVGAGLAALDRRDVGRS